MLTTDASRKHDKAVYALVAKAMNDLKFYIGAVSLDDLCYDIVIVDQETTPNKAYTIRTNIPLTLAAAPMMINIPFELIMHIIEVYMRLHGSLPHTLSQLHSRLHTFLAIVRTHS